MDDLTIYRALRRAVIKACRTDETKIPIGTVTNFVELCQGLPDTTTGAAITALSEEITREITETLMRVGADVRFEQITTSDLLDKPTVGQLLAVILNRLEIPVIMMEATHDAVRLRD